MAPQDQQLTKVPKFQSRIHVPELPGSFTFRKNGKLRLDQRVKKFCVVNQCRGCFEVKVHFGVHINPLKINYHADQEGVKIDTLGDQKKFKLLVPIPDGLTLDIPENPEAQFAYGVLSCKLAIVAYDKSKILNPHRAKKRSKVSLKVSSTIEREEEALKSEEQKAAEKKEADENKAEEDLLGPRPQKSRKRKKKSARLDELNKRIAKSGPPKKKQKVSKKKQEKVKPKSNEMDMNDQHKFIDAVVDRIETGIKAQRKEALKKDEDIKEFMENRAEKKKLKAVKKKAIRDKFQERRMAKKKAGRSLRAHAAGSSGSGKKVRFTV